MNRAIHSIFFRLASGLAKGVCVFAATRSFNCRRNDISSRSYPCRVAMTMMIFHIPANVNVTGGKSREGAPQGCKVSAPPDTLEIYGFPVATRTGGQGPAGTRRKGFFTDTLDRKQVAGTREFPRVTLPVLHM